LLVLQQGGPSLQFGISMKLIFAGTPEFAACALKALLDKDHDVALVLTQPDRPAGRGMKPFASPVKQLAQSTGLNILQPPTLKDAAVQQALREVAAEVMVVAAYGLMLPQQVLDIPRLGAINIHASLLPRWRGAAPIQRALLAGDRETGISIMCMEAGLDTGPVLLQESFAINPEETAQSLHDRLAKLGARMIVQTLNALGKGELTPKAQPELGVTYAHKLNKAEARISWSSTAEAIDRSIRAFNPFPGAHSCLKGVELKLWRAAMTCNLDMDEIKPGQVLRVTRQGITVACGQGVVELLELQRPGAKRLATADFLRGFPIVPGDCFEPG